MKWPVIVFFLLMTGSGILFAVDEALSGDGTNIPRVLLGVASFIAGIVGTICAAVLL